MSPTVFVARVRQIWSTPPPRKDSLDRAHEFLTWTREMSLRASDDALRRGDIPPEAYAVIGLTGEQVDGLITDLEKAQRQRDQLLRTVWRCWLVSIAWFAVNLFTGCILIGALLARLLK